VDDLLPIGRFARATRLSVKALRHDDELGLLRPAFVDPSSGYRYYRPAQANQAEAIRILRSVEMPLEEIAALLAESGDPVAKRLRLHRERLEARLDEHRQGIEPAPSRSSTTPTRCWTRRPAPPVEICFPVAAGFEATGEVYGTELPGGPAAVTVHRGPYAEITPAYHTVSGWIHDHGHELAGGPREVYLNVPGQVAEADLLTEVQWPIR
jgi:DNA-binding transcriptional MerR regulator